MIGSAGAAIRAPRLAAGLDPGDRMAVQSELESAYAAELAQAS